MVDAYDHRVLVPVDVLGGQGVPSTLIDALASIPVVVLGYHVVPDQTAPEQAHSKFGEQAQAELAELRGVFETAGCDVSTRLVFTRDRLKTLERVAIEDGCDGILLLNPAPTLERMLVAIRGDVNVEHIAGLVATVLAETDIEVTLFHVAANENARDTGEQCLEAAVENLVRQGVDPGRITRTIVVDGSPTDAILEAAADHDMLVAGESRPSLRRRIFKDRARRLAKGSVDPVLVVRGEYLETNPDGDGS